ncbi:MAG: FlgD immunoglobulin-like domain containing protein [Candidatus Altimarinota bacterium]
MKQLLRTGWAKKAILLAFVVGLVSPSALAYQVSPVETSGGYQVSPVETSQVAQVAPQVLNFNVNPTSTGATLSFSLNVPAKTTVWLKDSNDTIFKTLVFDADLNGGQTYNYTWNGTNNNNQAVANGTYKAQVVAYNTVDTDVESQNFTYTAGGGSQNEAPQVSVSVNPSSFNPSNGQTTSVNYTLNTQASLKVEIKSGSAIIRTLKAQTTTSAGSYNLVWDGRNDNGTIMSNGTYTAEVYASNSAGTAIDNASVTITSNGGGSQTAPNISNLNVSPNPFDPEEENTSVSFNLDKSATVTVAIMDGNTVVRNLTSNSSLSAGSHSYTWTGRDSNSNIVDDGTYTVRVTASNSAGTDTESTTVVVDTDGNNGGSCNVITSHYSNPSTFDPEEENTTINFSLNRTADVTIRIKDVNNVIRTLITDDSFNSGSRQVSWNGRNTSGNIVSDKTYSYEIVAEASGCDDETEYGTVRVDRDGNNGGDDDYEDDWDSTDEDLIRDLYVDNEVFDPTEGERSTVRFELTRRADLIVQVLDGTRVVKTLRDSDDQSAGDYSYTWDGRDSDGDRVNDDVYQYRVMADDGDDSDTDRAYVEVDTDGIIIGFPENSRCAGFRDVSKNSPFCKAIELMSARNIFDGYSDGTFRPYQKINRAETTKVVVLALDYDVNEGGSFGRLFPDTSSSAWYAPYLRTALDNDIIHGYPDGRFRPSNTINRVELLKIFLEANGVSFSSCPQPFDDTPITRDTEWYMRYACFAKDNDLMNAEFSRNLYPAEAMTRGDVADLFYDFDQMGYYDGYNNDNRYSYNDDRYYYDNDNGYYYSDDDNYDDGDGYYVYRNGRYEWVSY